MIFHEHKTIFLHIGKAAGVAVEQLLRPGQRDASKTDMDSLFGVDKSKGFYLQHASASIVCDLVGQQSFDNYYTFTVVRNPFARLVSAYYYLLDQHQQQFGSFENYVLSLPKLLSNERINQGSHHIPQTYYTHIKGKPICDHIAYFEYLPESIDPVRQLLGINAKLKKHNVSRKLNRPDKPISELFTKEMVQIVHTEYQSDFALLGYSLDPSQTKPLRKQVSSNTLRQMTPEKRKSIRAAKIIPRILHQIWIGPHEIPPSCQKWMQEWRDMHPDWEYKLWTDSNLPEISNNSWDVYHATKEYAGKADVLRYEIIKQFGGVYVDVDFECYKPIDSLLGGAEFFGVWPVEGRVCNGIFAAIPNHPILLDTVKNLVPKSPPGNGPGWLNRWVNDYLSVSNRLERVKIEKELTAFFPDYATAWPKTSFGKKVTRVSSRKHPFAKHHALKSWMSEDKRKNLHSFYGSSDKQDDHSKLMKLLCLCARPTGNFAMYEKLNELVLGIESWSNLLQLSQQHGMSALVYYHLREADIEVPADIKHALQTSYLHCRHESQKQAAILEQISEGFQVEGMEIRMLSSTALANTVYPDAALRCTETINLLIAQHHLGAAKVALGRIGLNFEIRAGKQLHSICRNSSIAGRKRNGIDVVLYSQDSLKKEYSKLVNSVADIENKSDSLGPEQMLWLAYNEALGRTQLYQSFRLISIADLVGIVETYNDVIDWQLLRKRGRKAYNAVSILGSVTQWAGSVKDTLPFDTQTALSLNPSEFPVVIDIALNGRKEWVTQFGRDTLTSSPWWACFYTGSDPARSNSFTQQVTYRVQRLCMVLTYLRVDFTRKKNQ